MHQLQVTFKLNQSVKLTTFSMLVQFFLLTHTFFFKLYTQVTKLHTHRHCTAMLVCTLRRGATGDRLSNGRGRRCRGLQTKTLMAAETPSQPRRPTTFHRG